MAAIEWEPIGRAGLLARVAQGEARMSAALWRLWDAIRIEPEKWRQRPYGDPGAGFWVVAIIGRTVVWYNDLEDGFNRSRYSAIGTIDDYWCNRDELEVTMQDLANVLEHGADLVRLARHPADDAR